MKVMKVGTQVSKSSVGPGTYDGHTADGKPTVNGQPVEWMVRASDGYVWNPTGMKLPA